ncbi:MAG: tetratricopeptide repeat protein [Nitrospinae bacterium]|nr:tetratricopeptide repeat protein [Nitrospinota bacterium]
MPQTDKALKALFDKYGKRRISIVMDNRNERKQVKNVLRDDGFSDISEFDDCKEAWEKLKLSTTSLLVFPVDHQDGLDFLKQLIESTRFKHTPLLLFTNKPKEHPKHYTNADALIYWAETPINGYKVEQALIEILKKGAVEKNRVLDESKALEHYNKGIDAFENGDFEEAKEELRQTLKESPDFFEAYLKMAETLFELEDYDAALRVLQKADQLQPDHPRALMIKAMVACETMEKEKALRVMDLCVSRRKNDLMFIIEMGNLALNKGWIDEAIGYFEMAHNIDPQLIHVYNRIGIAQSRAGRFDKALEMYSRALEMDDSDAGVHFNIGMTFYRKGEVTKAVESFKKAHTLDPKMKEPIEWLAKLEKGA